MGPQIIVGAEIAKRIHAANQAHKEAELGQAEQTAATFGGDAASVAEAMQAGKTERFKTALKVGGAALGFVGVAAAGLAGYGIWETANSVKGVSQDAKDIVHNIVGGIKEVLPREYSHLEVQTALNSVDMPSTVTLLEGTGKTSASYEEIHHSDAGLGLGYLYNKTIGAAKEKKVTVYREGTVVLNAEGSDSSRTPLDLSLQPRDASNPTPLTIAAIEKGDWYPVIAVNADQIYADPQSMSDTLKTDPATGNKTKMNETSSGILASDPQWETDIADYADATFANTCGRNLVNYADEAVQANVVRYFNFTLDTLRGVQAANASTETDATFKLLTAIRDSVAQNSKVEYYRATTDRKTGAVVRQQVALQTIVPRQSKPAMSEANLATALGESSDSTDSLKTDANCDVTSSALRDITEILKSDSPASPYQGNAVVGPDGKVKSLQLGN